MKANFTWPHHLWSHSFRPTLRTYWHAIQKTTFFQTQLSNSAIFKLKCVKYMWNIKLWGAIVRATHYISLQDDDALTVYCAVYEKRNEAACAWSLGTHWLVNWLHSTHNYHEENRCGRHFGFLVNPRYHRKSHIHNLNYLSYITTTMYYIFRISSWHVFASST